MSRSAPSWLTRSGATVVRYDTGAGEDTEWAFGLGCNGVVHVLLEPLPAGQPAPQLEMIEGRSAASTPRCARW
ncbi:MAG: hypothetical protein MZW92_65385 [Comamonadaceae bacterium]|nr:hypothetical protein [Comamonadaceae bacterium]